MQTVSSCEGLPSPANDDPAANYDIFDPSYVQNPYATWAQLRESCPMAHSSLWGGSWMAVRYRDVLDIAQDPARFSSRSVTVIPRPEEQERLLPGGSPPLTADPPAHGPSRRPLLSWFSPERARQYEPLTRDLCRRFAERLAFRGRGDAIADYAQRIPVRVLAAILGVPSERGDTFTGWIHDLLGGCDDHSRRTAAVEAILAYLSRVIAERKAYPGDDLVSALIHTEVDGHRLPDEHILGTVGLLLVAGFETTASVIGSALWHLATNPADRLRLVAERDLLPTAVEEFLRAYAPATMARIVTHDLEFAGCPMKEGDRVLLNFPAANRDGDAFVDADRVVIDRPNNRHLAFGAGIHRCVGSHLARMELRVALDEWLANIPEFHLDQAAQVTWSGGQVRGPHSLPLIFGAYAAGPG